MKGYLEGPSTGRRRREALIAAAALIVALILFFMPADYQEPVRGAVRATVLRPFVAIQAEVVEQRNTINLEQLRAQRDSLAALAAAQATLAEENRRLRMLLDLRQRATADFVAAEVIRPGVMGAQSSFFLGVGANAGVHEGSPVITAEGLLGVVAEVSDDLAQALDWTHVDFRASAMTADGRVYGIVEPLRGADRGGDLLVLSGASFHTDIEPGTRVVTSGRGGVYPRGIPIGTVVGIAEADTGWRKSYVLRPAVRPAEATHVLVGVGTGEGAMAGLAELWHLSVPPDTTGVAVGPVAADSL